MWWPSEETDIKKDIENAIDQWLPSGWNWYSTGMPPEVMKDQENREFWRCWEYVRPYPDNKPAYRDFLTHFANHSALKSLASKYGITKPEYAFYTPTRIKSLIEDWYVMEYRYAQAKENQLPNLPVLEERFRQLSRELADMLVLAANRYIDIHEKWENRAQERLRLFGFIGDPELKKIHEEIIPSMEWIIFSMSQKQPSQANISIALNIMHCNGSVLDYTPVHEKLDGGQLWGRNDLGDIDKFLQDMSNDKPVFLAEPLIHHDIITSLFPKEDHSRSWLGAKNKNRQMRL